MGLNCHYRAFQGPKCPLKKPYLSEMGAFEVMPTSCYAIWGDDGWPADKEDRSLPEFSGTWWKNYYRWSALGLIFGHCQGT